jgi:hypothetical protein
VAAESADIRARAAARSGGVAGNERLTGATAAVLFLLLLLEGVTIVSLDALMPAHILIGVALIPPVLLKIGSTAYRFARYYRGDATYVRRGPPPILLRVIGPVVVVSTVAVLASGVALLVAGPQHGSLSLIHKASFIAFFAVTSIHVLAHISKVPGQAAADWRGRSRLPGRAPRRLAVVVALIAGLLLGAAAITADGAWVHRGPHRAAATRGGCRLPIPRRGTRIH